MSLQIVNWGQKRLLIDTNRGYPPGNYHIPPEEKGDSSTQQCFGKGGVSSQEGISSCLFISGFPVPTLYKINTHLPI